MFYPNNLMIALVERIVFNFQNTTTYIPPHNFLSHGSQPKLRKIADNISAIKTTHSLTSSAGGATSDVSLRDTLMDGAEPPPEPNLNVNLGIICPFPSS